MTAKKVILLACGSYNPPTNMHLRIFELARDHLHKLGIEVLFGVISPVHDAYAKKDLASSKHRLEMLKLAVQDSDWIRVSDWECCQECHSRTALVLKYHQYQINSMFNNTLNDNINANDISWIPNTIRNMNRGLQNVQVKLLCGGDLLESFAVPGLWSNEDIETIVGTYGLVVVTRQNTNPHQFVYMSDVLTKYMSNILVLTEWITNDVSSTKIRRSLNRQESVKYLIPEKVIDYIKSHKLFGWSDRNYNTLTGEGTEENLSEQIRNFQNQ